MAATPKSATPKSATPASSTPAAQTPAKALDHDQGTIPRAFAAGTGAPSGAAASQPTPASNPSASPAAVASPTPGRRSINPFLNADPGQRARRLARALVSDLVAYHPKKRDEGLAQGTLRQLFREEIKKSYEEYVDQVGRESAESTPYFQEALNEILANGQPLF